MKKQPFIILVFALVICMTFASCSEINIFRPVDSLMTPPLYYSEYEGLVNAFNSSVTSGAVLCNPTSGDYLSAITVTDLDGDAAEEGIVFYKDISDGNIAHFSVFKGEGDIWNRLGDYRGYGDEIDQLIVTDIDGDSVKDIITVWSYSGISSGKVISVYRSEADVLLYNELMFESCDIALPVDIDGDDITEIFYITTSQDKNNVTKTAKLYRYENDSFFLAGAAPVDPFSVNYTGIKTSRADSFSTLEIYVDAVKSNNMMITEILYFDSINGRLVDPVYDPEVGTNTATLRYEQINCADINSDGEIEIPVQSVWTEGESTDESPLYVTEWTQFNGSEPVPVTRAFVNVQDGYAILLDELKNDDVFIRQQSGGDWTSWSVCARNGNDNIGSTLFTVVKIPKERWENNVSGSDSYITLFKRTDSVVCVRINEEGITSGINEETIKKITIKLP